MLLRIRNMPSETHSGQSVSALVWEQLLGAARWVSWTQYLPSHCPQLNLTHVMLLSGNTIWCAHSHRFPIPKITVVPTHAVMNVTYCNKLLSKRSARRHFYWPCPNYCVDVCVLSDPEVGEIFPKLQLKAHGNDFNTQPQMMRSDQLLLTMWT